MDNVWMHTYGKRIGDLIQLVKEAQYRHDAKDLNLNELVIMFKSCTTEITKLNEILRSKETEITELKNTIDKMLNGNPDQTED